MWWAPILKWLTGDLVGQLSRLYEARLKAKNEAERLALDKQIAFLEAKMADDANSASVVKEGMKTTTFWVVWAIAAVPTAAWYAWGMLDSMLWAGAILPDVAALPPQLKQYADIVFANIFYVGGGVAGAQVVANAIRGSR